MTSNLTPLERAPLSDRLRAISITAAAYDLTPLPSNIRQWADEVKMLESEVKRLRELADARDEYIKAVAGCDPYHVPPSDAATRYFAACERLRKAEA